MKNLKRVQEGFQKIIRKTQTPLQIVIFGGREVYNIDMHNQVLPGMVFKISKIVIDVTFVFILGVRHFEGMYFPSNTLKPIRWKPVIKCIVEER